MDTAASSSATSRWTLADFLSSYAFWALFLSSLLLTAVGQSLLTFLPMIARDMAIASETMIGISYFGVQSGWIIGGFIAFVVTPRHGRSSLVWPLITCTAVLLFFLPMSGVLSGALLLILFGTTFGVAQSIFPLALAILLVGGRPSRIDFGGALAILSAAALIATFGTYGASILLESGGVAALLIVFVICLMISIGLVLGARNLSFEGMPRPRHKPITPHQRSPFVVAAILLSPVALSILTTIGSYVVSPDSSIVDVYPNAFYLMLFVIVVVSVIAFVYLGYWLYRIHGELAGAAPSQRLLTPLAAIPIGLFVPLALPVMVMTLGDILNDRAKEKGEPAPLSVAWLAIFTILIPPIGIAMIQSAANRSYAIGAGMPAGQPA